jgi:hypothetical protein
MNEQTRERLNGVIKVPTWIMVVTYFMCWGFGIALIGLLLWGDIQHQGVIIATAVYLITWPVFQANPSEIIRRVFPS